MANYKVPRHLTLVDQLPVSAAGKVLKYRLREAVKSDVKGGLENNEKAAENTAAS
jgi:acyl-CoA synthetase (AMP-forming)/AMP-acid ligase II